MTLPAESASGPEALRARYALLGQVAIISTLPDGVLRSLARQLVPRDTPGGTVVAQQGEAGDSLYIIERGRYEVSVKSAQGHDITIAVLGRGDFFGETATLAETEHDVTVRASEPSRLLELHRDALFATVPPESDALIDLTRLVEQRAATLANIIAKASMAIPEQAATTIAVYSPKGGSGRSTIAINVAAQLATMFPGEVLLVDLGLPFNHDALLTRLIPTGSLATAGAAEESEFEDKLLSALLHHPGGLMLLPGVLKPEQAELVTTPLLLKAMGLLAPAFRYFIVDLGVALTETALTILEHSQRVILVVTPELSSLKDASDLLRLFDQVLHFKPDRIVVVLNNKMPKALVSSQDVAQTLNQPIAVEMGFDGAKVDEASVRGDILALSDPKSATYRAAQELADVVIGVRNDRDRPAARRLPFGFKVPGGR